MVGSGGDETWHKLAQWTLGQASSERLAGQVLRLEGYTAVDPSHPLGGPDGLKDLVAIRDGEKWVAAAYFPRRQKTFAQIRSKLEGDAKGIEANGATGIAFLTNQEVTLSERAILQSLVETPNVEIYHLERVAQILDSPRAYGVRLEFLGVSMSPEEQVSFFQHLELQNAERLRNAFKTERVLLAMEAERRAKASLRSHSTTVLPLICDFRLVATQLTTPMENRGAKFEYNPDFSLNDLRDLYKPSLINRFPLLEPTVERYTKVQRSLVAELVSLARHVDHSSWPELASVCQDTLGHMSAYDYLDAIESTSEMSMGGRPARDVDPEMLARLGDDDFSIVGSDILDKYRALALQVKLSMPLLDRIEMLVREHIS